MTPTVLEWKSMRDTHRAMKVDDGVHTGAKRNAKLEFISRSHRNKSSSHESSF
jgi:hypothetical protein